MRRNANGDAGQTGADLARGGWGEGVEERGEERGEEGERAYFEGKRERIDREMEMHAKRTEKKR